jgi:phosphoglycerate dehydrogenase-like enzyme
VSVCYLSTLQFTSSWLDELRAHAPDVEVVQVQAEQLEDVPEELWARVDVLHTSAVLPEVAGAPRLRWVQLDTSGVDHVVGTDLWRNPQVEITTIGGVSPVPLAEFVLFGILGFAHRLPALRQLARHRSWPMPGARFREYMPMPLAGATLVVIGYGRIGRQIARLAQAFGMSVVGVTRSGRAADTADAERHFDFPLAPLDGPADPAGVEVVDGSRLHEVLGRADFVAVVVPLTEQSRNLVDRAAIAALKPGAVLINAARGGVVDEDALRDALRSGALSGALLDVFADEPLPPDSPWWDVPEVFITPHVAGLAPRYAEQVLSIVAENLRRFTTGQPLLNRVDRTLGY